jgi:NAD(P)-dependent dehydrogenase (short-subunit alcohol dehydrogenase family)
MTGQTNAPRRTMLLTGASRGIGHATVKRFSSAGWRVITCSRQPFPEECPWMAGPEDHLQIDLADPVDTQRAIAEVRERLENGRLDALVNNAGVSPKGPGGSRLGTIETELADWLKVFHVNFFSTVMLARGLLAELETADGVGEPGQELPESDSGSHAENHPECQVAFEDVQPLRRGGHQAVSPFDGDGSSTPSSRRKLSILLASSSRTLRKRCRPASASASWPAGSGRGQCRRRAAPR